MTEFMRADQPVAWYQMPIPEGAEEADSEILRVSEIVAHDDVMLDTLETCAIGVSRVMRQSWYEKMVMSDVMTEANLSDVIKSPYQQQRAITEADPKEVRYLVTSTTGFNSIKEPDDIRAVLRMEAYHPKMPISGNLLRRPYPNITDLETMSGKLATGEYRFDAMALMHVVTAQSDPLRKISAYTERENPDGIKFFEDIGLVDLGAAGRHDDQRVSVGTRRFSDESVTQVSVGYVHMEARHAELVHKSVHAAVGHYMADYALWPRN